MRYKFASPPQLLHFSSKTPPGSTFLKNGLHNHLLILTKFTSIAFSLCSLPLATSLLFSPFSSPRFYDTFLFNTVIRAHTNSNSRHLSISYFSLMLRVEIPPNKFTFLFLLKSCSPMPDPLTVGAQIHAMAIKFRFDDDPYARNTLIHMYVCCEEGIECAYKVFDRMPKTDAVTWSTMISGLVRLGRSDEAVGLFREMQMEGFQHDEVMLISVLSVCADSGALELTKWIGSFIERGRIEKSLPLCNVLIDALAKCRDLDGAFDFFNRMPQRTIVSWTAVVDGIVLHAQGEEAVSVFEAMRNSWVKPDDVAFVGVLNACSHAGLVNEG